MSKAQQAAEERYPSYPVVGFSGAEDRQVAFLAGVAWALPENPDPAVIEAMARAIAPNRWREVHRKPLGDIPQARWDALLDQAIAEGREPSLEAARAAYAAMRGAQAR